MADSIETQRADPIARRKLLRRLWPLAVLGLLIAAGLTIWINATAREGALAPLITALLVLCLISLAMLKPLQSLWRFGRDARQQRRYPPLGLAVVRDTRVQHGDIAQRRGERLQDLAVLMALFVVLLPITIAWLLVQLAI